jgi:hypothetical protein
MTITVRRIRVSRRERPCDATYSTGSEFCVDGGILAEISVGD